VAAVIVLIVRPRRSTDAGAASDEDADEPAVLAEVA
jgi:hypothetical protein